MRNQSGLKTRVQHPKKEAVCSTFILLYSKASQSQSCSTINFYLLDAGVHHSANLPAPTAGNCFGDHFWPWKKCSPGNSRPFKTYPISRGSDRHFDTENKIPKVMQLHPKHKPTKFKIKPTFSSSGTRGLRKLQLCSTRRCSII